MEARRCVFIALLCATVAIIGRAQTPPIRIIGLVEVPQLFNLYSPDGNRIAPPKNVGIGLRTRPLLDSPTATTVVATDQLNAKEYGYEELGAVVYARDGNWSFVETSEGIAGWLAPADAGAFHSLESLITRGLTYLTDDWNGFVLASPESANREFVRADLARTGGPENWNARTVGTRQVGDALWVEVEVLSHSFCEDPRTPPVVSARGWIPAHAPSGRPNIWFYSRGC
jgi:hypothetical protein